MLGGGLNGGKIMGNYPEDLSDKSDYWVRRGRMIPTVPFDSVWNGISQWMGVQGDDDLNFVLPNRINFEKCSRMFTGHDLFKNMPASECINDSDGDGVADESDRCPNTSYWLDAEVDEFGCQGPTTMSPTMSPVITSSPSSTPTVITYSPTSTPTVITFSPTSTPTTNGIPTRLYEAEDSKNHVYGSEVVTIDTGHTGTGHTGTGIVDFGGSGSWLEWTAVSGGSGGSCTLDFRYAVSGTRHPRICDVKINGLSIGSATFTKTGSSWEDYSHYYLQTTCQPGINTIRVTASSGNGGPNMDNLQVYATNTSPSPSPTSDPTKTPTGSPTSVPTAEPTQAPTGSPTSSPTLAPTSELTQANTSSPTLSPTSAPTSKPSLVSITDVPTDLPTSTPTAVPTRAPTGVPTTAPTSEPTTAPATDAPSSSPTSVPTAEPTHTSAPTGESKLVAVNSIIGFDTGTTLDRCVKAIDGTTNRCTISRNEFESKELAGFVAVATSGKSSIVKKIRVYNSDNCKFCDPTSYQIEGRNSESEDWKIISSGEIRLSRKRNQQGIPITSTYENGDLTRKFGESEIDNNMEYSQYKVTFPTSKNRRESKLRFAEVELPGFIYV